jgi:hypothetical protein
MIDELIRQATAAGPLNQAQVVRALQGSLGLIDKHADRAKTQELYDAVPGAQTLAQQGAKDVGKGKGMIPLPGPIGDAMGMLNLLKKEGIGQDDLKRLCRWRWRSCSSGRARTCCARWSRPCRESGRCWGAVAVHLARFPRALHAAPDADRVPAAPDPRAGRAGGVDQARRPDRADGGGNKTRKLEFLVAEALAQGADTLITVGAVQSNHCRLTLAAAVREGLKCRLVLEQRVPGSYDPAASGNNLLFDLLGVEALTVVEGGADLAGAMQAIADDLASQGRRGYVIPGGGSTPLGALGYVACAEEMLAQTFETGLGLDHVVVASGSAGTHAGLLVGLTGRTRGCR